MLAYRRLGKALDNRITGYYSRARFTLLWGYPCKWLVDWLTGKMG